MSSNHLDALRVQPDIGAEAHMINAEALANAEWWKFFAGIVVLTIIIVITSYVKFNQNIWAAGVNGWHDKAEKYKKTRHIVAVLCVSVAAVILALFKVYMMPYTVSFEARAYDELYLLNHIYGFEVPDEPVTSNITFDLVIRRSIVGTDNVFGMFVVDESRYVIYSDSTVEKSGMYSLCSGKEGEFLPDLGVSMYTTKDFTKFKFYDSYKEDICDFVGPAKSVEEAEEIFVEIDQMVFDKFAIKIE